MPDTFHIRKAAVDDLDAIAAIYDEIHTAEEQGDLTIGWIRDIYPTRETGLRAIEDGEMFVAVDGGKVVASAKINQSQEDSYAGGSWEYPAQDSEVMVLHTLTVSPSTAKRGYGTRFAAFYESYALENGCPYLRIDTNERNAVARKLYAKLGYKEVGIVPTDFNGIPGINLVLLEKKALRTIPTNA